MTGPHNWGEPTYGCNMWGEEYNWIQDVQLNRVVQLQGVIVLINYTFTESCSISELI